MNTLKPTVEVVISTPGPLGFTAPKGPSKVSPVKFTKTSKKDDPKPKKAKKAIKAKATKKAKGTKEGTWFKGPTRKVSIEKITKTLKTPRTIIELAKMLDVSHTGAQNYIRDVKKAGVKLEKKNTRQGKRGPMALTFQVTGNAGRA